MNDNNQGEKFSYFHSFPDPLLTLNFSLKSLDECLGDSLVVLDANVLLLPFKTGPHALDEIEKALERLKNEKRLFVPQHALREFLANRPTKIKDFFEQLNKQRNKDYSVLSVAKLVEKVEAYPQLLEAEKRLKDEVENFRSAVAAAIDEVRKWTTNDPVSKMYQRVFSDEIIVRLIEDHSALDKEHKERNAKAIPPGYKDSSKGQNGIGDFVIWKTVLQIGKQNTGRNLIFVTGEEKADWVYRGSSEILYAREELIEEYRNASTGGTFHLIDFATLLKYLKASDKAVAEVKLTEAHPPTLASELDEGEIFPNLRWSDFAILANKAVGIWLEAVAGHQNVLHVDDDTGIDYIVTMPTLNSEDLIQVKVIRHYEHFEKRIRENIRYLEARVKNRVTQKYALDVQAVIVFVCESKSGAYYIEEAQRLTERANWLHVRAGYLEANQFIPANRQNIV